MNTAPYAQSSSLLEAPTVANEVEVRAENLPSDLVDFYRDNGFVRVRGIVSRKRALELGTAAANFASSGENFHHSPIFQQLVNVWTRNEALRALTLVMARPATH